MKKKNLRQIQAETTKKHLMDTASALLAQKTLDEIGIQEICKTAGVSVGAFYHHFGSKAGIIIEMYKDVDIFFVNEIIPSMEEHPAFEAIIEYLTCQCQYAYNMGLDLVRNAYKAQIDNGNLFFLSNDRGLPDGLRTLIARAKRDGQLGEDVCIEDLTNELLILARGVIYHWCVSGGQSDMSKSIRHMASRYLESYRTQP